MANPLPAIYRPRSVALVDVGNVFKKRYHTWDKKEHMGAAKAALRDIADLCHGVEHLILCRDAPPYFRSDIDATYKAQRPAREPEEIANAKHLYEEIKRLGYRCAWAQGFEADDVIATLAHEYGAWCDDVRIVGPDKDMCQCITDNVRQYIPPVGEKDWVVRDAAGVLEKFKVPPEGMVLFQALAGDAGDNFKGVKGIGPTGAAQLASTYLTLEALTAAFTQQAQVMGAKPNRTMQLLAAGWEDLVKCYKLATLRTDVPLDAEALLEPRGPEAAPAPRKNSMDISPAGQVTEAEYEEVFQHAKQVYETRYPQKAGTDAPPESATASKDDALIEQEQDRERQQSGEHDAVSNEPGRKAAEPAQPRKPEAKAQAVNQIVKRAQEYGLVDSKLQPLDLTAAYTVSAWLLESALYPQFKTEAQIFAVIARGKELGLGMTTALAGFHMLKGKPVPSADLLRALAARDPTFEYLYPKEMSPTKVVWIGKAKGMPEPVLFTYTIEDATKAGLCKAGNYGDDSNWKKIPQEMLNKTAGSKLARLLWPAACLGLYCIEELGSSEEELERREAWSEAA